MVHANSIVWQGVLQEVLHTACSGCLDGLEFHATLHAAGRSTAAGYILTLRILHLR